MTSWGLSDWIQVVTSIIGSAAALIAIIAAVWWFLAPRLKSWAERELLQPVKRVDRQVSENHHANAQPTLPDRLDTVSGQLMRLAGQVTDHQAASMRTIQHMNRRIGALERRVDHMESNA